MAPVLLAVAAFVVETVLMAGLARGWPASWLVAGHGLVVASLGAWVRGRPTSRGAMLLWVATACFGPFGAAGTLLTLGLERHYGRRATSMEEWHAMLFPPVRPDGESELWRRIGQRASDRAGGSPVTPFLDVLAFGSMADRQAVVAVIARRFHPTFAPALKAALRDEHNAVRVQAATAIARIEQDFLDETRRLEAAIHDRPDDADAVLALARHHDAQAFAGLFDPMREAQCRAAAASGYQQYLERRPDDHVVRFELGRLQQRRGECREAEALFRPLAAIEHPSARLWLMESLFAQRRFADLRQVAAAAGSEAGDEAVPEVAATLRMWSGEAAA